MAEKNFSTPNNGVSVGARKERNMRDGLAIITQSVNRVTSFRTPRRTPKKGAEKNFSTPNNGVSVGARTRTEGVGGLYGIQFHHGHILKNYSARNNLYAAHKNLFRIR